MRNGIQLASRDSSGEQACRPQKTGFEWGAGLPPPEKPAPFAEWVGSDLGSDVAHSLCSTVCCSVQKERPHATSPLQIVDDIL